MNSCNETKNVKKRLQTKSHCCAILLFGTLCNCALFYIKTVLHKFLIMMIATE